MSYRNMPVSTSLVAFAATVLVACGSGKNAGTPDAPTGGPDAQDVETPAGEPADSTVQERAASMDVAADEPEDDSMQAAAAAEEDGGDDDGDPCTLTIRAGDNIAYSTNSMSVPASCTDVSVTLVHTGNLPATAMGHNWVLIPAGGIESIAMAGMNAGPDMDYVPADDPRVIAATRLVGGGESDTVTFPLADLTDGTSYVYVCTFPGHWSVMQGTFTVTG